VLTTHKSVRLATLNASEKMCFVTEEYKGRFNKSFPSVSTHQMVKSTFLRLDGE
jgi:hypothetical protein